MKTDLKALTQQYFAAKSIYARGCIAYLMSKEKARIHSRTGQYIRTFPYGYS